MRIALIGLGNAGQTLHLPALAGLPEASVVGACDTDPQRRDEVATEWKVPVFPSHDEMLERTAPDVLVIGTPPDSHKQYCLDGLAAGAHILCEKPFVSSLDEADEVLDAARQAGRQVALNHEFREMPIFRALRDQVGRPDIGELVFAQVWQNMDLPPWKEPGWRGKLLQRTLYEAGVHLIDYLVALFGESPRAVSATVSSCGVRDSHSDAVALATLEFSRGRLAHVIQNRLCPGATQYFEVRAECRHASLRASFGGRARLSAGLYRSTRPHVRFEFGTAGIAWREVGNRRIPLGRNPRDPGMVATRLVFARTLAAFADGSEPPASGAAARDVLEIIAACYQSAERGQRVTIDSTTRADLATMRMGA